MDSLKETAGKNNSAHSSLDEIVHLCQEVTQEIDAYHTTSGDDVVSGNDIQRVKNMMNFLHHVDTSVSCYLSADTHDAKQSL